MLESRPRPSLPSLVKEACVNLRNANGFPLQSQHSLSGTAINPAQQWPAVFRLRDRTGRRERLFCLLPHTDTQSVREQLTAEWVVSREVHSALGVPTGTLGCWRKK